MRHPFYFGWILANAAAESIGLGTTLFLGQFASSYWKTPTALTILFGATVAVLLGILLEGVLVGLAQGWVLRRRLPSLSIPRWVLATAIGAGIAWLLGMTPSTIIALHEVSAPAQPVATEPAARELAPWLQYVLAAVMGAILGPILGVAQVQVLKQHASRPYGWLWANAIAWSVGMVIIFIGMDWVPWNAGRLPIVISILLVCGVSGAVVGAIHGYYLLRVLAPEHSPGTGR